MSATTKCKPRAEPAGMDRPATPSLSTMQQPEPGVMNCTTRTGGTGPHVVVEAEAYLLRIKVLGAVDVGYWHQFKSPVYAEQKKALTSGMAKSV